VPTSLTGKNSAVSLDPTKLPGGKTAQGTCAPVWPHDFVRTNSVFAVIHRRHLPTAWADKHPAYDILNGNDPDNWGSLEPDHRSMVRWSAAYLLPAVGAAPGEKASASSPRRRSSSLRYSRSVSKQAILRSSLAI
jgi:hypothetical protein